MSDDQSFYEIQLNTPHLVLAFLGAAVIGVTVFWLGVVIGRGQTEPGLSEEWQAAAPAAGETEDEPYEFYEAVSEPANDPQAGTPAAEDPPAGQPAEQPAEEPAAAQPDPTRFTPADPVDEEPVRVAAESEVGMPRPDATLASGWIVQVRSFPDKGDADRLQTALVTSGFPAFVVSTEVDGETWHRVRVGRYRSKAEADIIEAELLTRSDVDTTWVTEG